MDGAHSSNLTEELELLTASLRDRKIRTLDYQSIFKGGFAHLVSPAGDGRAVYFWSSPAEGSPGPVVRFDGLRRTRITPIIANLGSVAAGGGRYALAREHRRRDCATEPSWSPHGKRIAYITCQGALWVMNANGTGARRIATSARGPDWSPTGAGLAFENAAGAVVVAAADGKDAHDVVSNGADPAWSPDGTRLAFVRAGAIFVSGADGSDERLLVNSGAEPDWSPDGGRLVFARPARPNPGLEIMPVDGGAGRSLTAGFDSEPAWSPDGRSIAFTHCWNPHRNCPDDATVIRAIRPDGTGARTLSFADDEVYDSSPSWAPDSRRLVYASAAQYEDGGDSHLRLAPGARLLTRTPTPRAAVVIHARGGRVLARITPVGEALALAVTRTVTAVLVRGRSGVRVEIYAPHRRTIRLRRASARELAAHGSLLAFRVGRTIYEIDARRGRAHVVARASTTPIGLSIVGRRIAWAENLRPGRARIRTLVRPR